MTEVGRRLVILGPSLFFRCFSMSLAFRSCGFGRHLHKDVHFSLFTQPAPQGRPSRFSSHRKGAGLPHPIRGGGSGLPAKVCVSETKALFNQQSCTSRKQSRCCCSCCRWWWFGPCRRAAAAPMPAVAWPQQRPGQLQLQLLQQRSSGRWWHQLSVEARSRFEE